MTPFELITLAAAAWYVAYILTNLPGPFGSFARAREWRGGRWHGRVYSVKYTVVTKDDYVAVPIPPQEYGGELVYHGLFDCILCTIFWVAQIIAFITGHSILEGIAVAGIGLWAHSWFGWRIDMG